MPTSSEAFRNEDIISAIILIPLHLPVEKREKMLCSICIIWTRGFVPGNKQKMKKEQRRSPTRSGIPKITHSLCLIWIHDELISRIWLFLHRLHLCLFRSSWAERLEEKASLSTFIKSNIINMRAQIVFSDGITGSGVNSGEWIRRKL